MRHTLLILLTAMIFTLGCNSGSSVHGPDSPQRLSGKEHLPSADVLHELLQDYPLTPTPDALDQINLQLRGYGSWRCEQLPHGHETGVSYYALGISNTGGFSEWGITIKWRVFEGSGPERITISYGKRETKPNKAIDSDKK